MKKEIQGNMLKAFTLLLTTVCLLACFTDAEAQEDIIDYSKYGDKGAAARLDWLLIPEKEYDPNTKAYCDALWMRVHEENCPMLVLGDMKQVITLEQADQEGWRIGESGQSGRDRCCFQGYRRKYPEADIPEDANGIAQKMSSEKIKWHYAGCHRFTVSPEDSAMTPIEAEEWGAKEEGYYMCEHCIERGPSLTTADMETLRNRPAPPTFTPPEDWTPEPFSPDNLPSKEEIDILIQQTLANGYAIQEAPYTDPMASLEEFMGRRFFFPVGQWLNLYQAYRSTGDKRLLDALRVSARHYTKLCVDYPDVAQLKARNPEHLAFMYSMAVSSRITLQLALKQPDEVSSEELREAEEFLTAIVSALKPVLEGNDSLDSVMGIPQEIADDFRSRAFNRALNGIGSIGMATAALEDLQALNSTTEYQPTIDRYRKVIREYIKNWKNTGFKETYNGDDYFSYPYSATDNGYMVGDVKLFGADDQGHFSHSLQGAYLLYESVPELGVDDAFMTAIANTIHFNSYTTSGSPQTPSQEAIRPLSRHPFGAPSERFYLLEAFKNGVIEGQCSKLSEEKKAAVNSSYENRLKTLHAQYMKALRKVPSIIYLCITNPAQTNPIKICMVSVDSSNHNIILWDQLNDVLYDSVFIYKESSQSDLYTKVGSLSALESPLFSDVESNPEQNSSRYKISALNTCGYETELSSYHKTLHLTISLDTSGNRNLIWDRYEGFDYSTIHIYRGNSNKDLVKIADQASNTFTYTDLDHSGNKNYYQIEIINPFPCSVNSSSSKKYAGTSNYESTKSNIVSYKELTSLALIEKSNFEIYPNPANNALYVKTNGGNEINISIVSTDGKVIKSNRYQNENIEIDISDLNTGIYILRCENQDNLISKKLVKN